MASVNKYSSQRVVIFSHFYDPHLGGVETHVKQQARWLDQIGCQVDVITKRFDNSLDLEAELEGIRVSRFQWPELKIFGLFLLWIRLLKRYYRLVSKADLVYVHDVMIFCWLFRLIFPAKKMVLVMHGWEGKYPVPFKNKLIRWISAKLANRVVGAGEYIQHFYPVKLDQIMWGGVIASMFASPEQFKSKFNLDSEGGLPRLVYLGRLEADTGLEQFIDLVEAEPNLSNLWQFVFVGDGPLRPRCEKIGRVTGWLDKDQVKSELLLAHLTLVGGYLAAVEALAAGSLIMAIAQHQLKLDYWQLSPFGDRMMLLDARDRDIQSSFGQALSSLACELSSDQLVSKLAKISLSNQQWAKQLTWKQVLAQLYLSDLS